MHSGRFRSTIEETHDVHAYGVIKSPDDSNDQYGKDQNGSNLRSVYPTKN
jgi:hypothetical protein